MSATVDQNASTDAPTLPAVPLAAEVTTNGRNYRLVERKGNLAIYGAQLSPTDPTAGTTFEVWLIRVANERTFPNGQTIPRREVPPSTDDWGQRGWSFTTVSHADPLTAARKRLGELA
jgi:hypothetical protein